MELTAPNTEATELATSTWRDWMGIVASVGCAIHCAAMPFVIAYLPALGLSFLADEAFHKWMALVCFLIAIVAFIPGLRKHGSWVPISIGAFGLAIITYAAFGLAGECCPSCAAAKAAPADGSTAMVAGTDGGCEACESCSACSSEHAAPSEGSVAHVSAASTDGGCEACESCSSCSGEKDAATDGSAALVAAKTDGACDSCDSCSSCSSSETAIANASDESEEKKGLLAILAPWITPFGGIVLVTAHLVNRQYGFKCGCCKTPLATA